MNRLVPTRFWIAVAVFSMLLSSGCAVTGPSGTSANSTATIPDDAFVGDRELLSEYASASGKLCRRYKNDSETGLLVRCLTDAGQWQNTKQLSGIYSNSRMVSLMGEASEEPSAATATILRDDFQTVNSNDSAALAVQEADIVVLSPDYQPGDSPAALSIDEHSATPVEIYVEAGESLWRLSQRVTGSGANWTEIARFNALGDGNSIQSGQRILVPPTLLK